MLCAYCRRTKHRDGFPMRAFAQCWECAWDDHVAKSHPKVVKAIRKEAKKRAKARVERDEFAAMFEHEKRQVLGVAAAKDAS